MCSCLLDWAEKKFILNRSQIKYYTYETYYIKEKVKTQEITSLNVELEDYFDSKQNNANDCNHIKTYISWFIKNHNPKVITYQGIKNEDIDYYNINFIFH